MSNISGLLIELLHEPIDAARVVEIAEAELQNRNRLLLKVGIAACVLDEDDRMLVSLHEQRDGEFAQWSKGPITETLRYVTDKNVRRPETPYEVFQRGLDEELSSLLLSKGTFSAAGLYFDRRNPLIAGEWSLGPRDGYNEVFVIGATVIARTARPEFLVSELRVSNECLATRFMSVPEIVADTGPKRQGFVQWLNDVSVHIQSSGDYRTPELAWMVPPEVLGENMVYPFSA